MRGSRDSRSRSGRRFSCVFVAWFLIHLFSNAVEAATCEAFLELIRQGKWTEVEKRLYEDRLNKACAYYLARAYLDREKIDQAIEWINFARVFVNRDRDPRLYPEILYYKLVLDPEPSHADQGLIDYDPDRDYNELLGYVSERLDQLSTGVKVAFIPELRSYLTSPWGKPCPERFVWANRLRIDIEDAREICAHVVALEALLREKSGDPRRTAGSGWFLERLRELGVDTETLVQSYQTSVADIEIPLPDMKEGNESKRDPAAKSVGSGGEERTTRDPAPIVAAVHRDGGEARRAVIEMLGFVKIPRGIFRFGCTTGDVNCQLIEKPSRRVRISMSFLLAAFETTNAAYRKCVEAGVCEPPEDDGSYRNPDRADYPVAQVAWEDARTFCSWLGGRLPTEAEWEYAARGLVVGDYYSYGKDIDHNHANYVGTSEKDIWPETAPVGSFPPNTFKLYDMAGNVREWVNDWFGSYKNGQKTDPTGPSSNRSHLRVMRGGGWKDEKEDMRVSARRMARESGRHAVIGFRCVLPLAEQP